MKTLRKSVQPRLKYPLEAYRFLFSALRYTQDQLGRVAAADGEDEHAHISGVELLDGFRAYALEQFGLMSLSVFHAWGIYHTDDVGRMVFELVDRGEMRKTPHDQLSDFFDVYDFEKAFAAYRPNIAPALS